MNASQLMELCDDLLLMVEPDSLRIAASTPAVQRLLGWDEFELQTMVITDIECALTDIFFWNDIQSGQRPTLNGVEGLYRDASEEIINVEKSVFRAVFDGGEYIGVRLRVTDHEKQMADALERTAAVLRATLESTSYGVLVTDTDNAVVNMNRRFAELLHLPDMALQKGADRQLLHALIRRMRTPKDFRHWLEETWDARERETSIMIELRDATIVQCRSQPQIAREQVIGRVFTVEDITAQILTQRDLVTARDKAESASKSKTEFLSHMSHELRTPLNAIIGFAQLGSDEDGPYQETFGIIERAGSHLLNLINEVLNLAQVEAGKLELHLQPVNANTVIMDCFALVQGLADKYQVRLENAQLPAHAWVAADPLRLKQMLLNLLSNAIKYNRTNGRVWITVAMGSHSNWKISICDDGIGISADDQKKLFDSFTRVGSKQNKVEGTGIGLAFSRKLAQLMKGDITLISAADLGSQFCITLPATQAVAGQQEQDKQRAQKVQLPACTILYIEDDAFSRKLVQTVFKKHPSVTLLSAENGATGMEYARTRHCDLVLTDMHLGDYTGIDILHQYRASAVNPFAPMIMLSAGVSEDEREYALAQGINSYLSKPVQIPQLLQTLQMLLSAD